MAYWNPEKYLLFQKQRTQPAIDLAMRISGLKPAVIADIGCGPGNSTAVLRSVFPEAETVLGLDYSVQMIDKARQLHPELRFEVCPAEEITGSYDLLFSNACLQWVPGHRTLLPQLMSHLREGGVLAVQMPANQEEPLYRVIREVAADSRWGFSGRVTETNGLLPPDAYFDILSGCQARFEMWETVYYHVLPSHAHLLQWVRETRLRPYLAVLGEAEKAAFEQEILTRAKPFYPLTGSGEVVFRFKRFFFTAYRA
ncbi:methyltransferase domain-containing protein [Butyricicoccus sp. 1XD8-22]|nr:methyltransferase domain-containing protein [Butyricicoccus sp. 1XD8-22]